MRIIKAITAEVALIIGAPMAMALVGYYALTDGALKAHSAAALAWASGGHIAHYALLGLGIAMVAMGAVMLCSERARR